jgi:uncharacterized protein YciI
MQFLIIGKDGEDEGAKERRAAARQAHLELGEQLRQAGNMWYGAALWDNDNQMIGSMLLMDFPSENELREWLSYEPYVTGKVWVSVDIQKCNVREPWQFNRPKEWFDARNND